MISLYILVASASSIIDLPVGAGSMAPHLLESKEGIRLTWLEPTDDGHALRSSIWSKRWSTPSTIAKGGLFANWADTPIAALAGDGSVVVSYPRKSGSSPYAYDVVFARSTDGTRWTDLGSPHRDGTQTEHGFPSIVPEEEGFRAFWLDGRATAEEGPMALRTALWDGAFSKSSVLDPRVCDCCGTSATLTSGGWALAYRDRSAEEIRDTRIATAGGTHPVGVDGWHMPGCPVNGPKILSTPGGTIVAWTTGAPGSLEVRVALDGAEASAASRVLAPAANKPVGRVDLVPFEGGAIAIWLGSEAVLARRLEVEKGELVAGAVSTVGAAPTSRSTGFPRSAIHGDSLLSVWTTDSGVVAHTVPLSHLKAPHQALPRTRAVSQEVVRRRPSLRATTLDGKPWELDTVKGPVFVALWASWCGPCRAELPALRELANTYEVPLVVIAVDDNAASVRRAAKDRPGLWVTASRAAVEAAFHSSAVPELWRFSDDGEVVWHGSGVFEVAAAGEGL